MAQKIASLKARREFQERLKHGLVTHPVLLSCDHCSHQISSEMEWSCGYCHYANRRTALYSLLYKCQKCDREPKSCTCPKCGTVVFLDEDRDIAHPACKTKKKTKSDSSEDPQAKKRRAHAERIEEKQREIEYELLEAKLAQIKRGGQGPKEETEHEKMRRFFKKRMDAGMAASDIAEEYRKAAHEENKDNPERLSEAEDVIQSILEELSLNGKIP